MSFEELEELIRKYLSTGIAVVVILVAPGTEATPGGALPADPSIRVIEPDRAAPAGADSGGGDPAPAPDAGERGQPDPAPGSPDGSVDGPDERTGAAGRDPDRGEAGSGDSGSGEGSRSDDDPGAGADGSSGGGSPDDATGDDSSGDDSKTDSDSGSNSEPDSDSGSGSDSDPGSDSDSGSGSGSGSNSGSDSDDSSGSDGADPSDADGRSGGGDASGSANRSDRSGGGAAAGTGADASVAITAAQRHGWGTPDREDDFSAGTEQWDIYDGPGHDGKGTRSPSAVSVQDGILMITGDSSGTTAGMAWNPGQKYGRWEGRVRAPVADPSYNALLLLWPDAEDFPVGGEIDFMEMMDPDRRQTDIFIHYGEDNSQVNGKVEVDGTEWHNWAVEWTPKGITAYVDGEEWYRTTDTSILPPGPMHLCIQLDWFPEGDTPKESTMQVDWVRQYSLDGAGSSAQESGSGGDSDGASDSGDSRPGRQSDSGATDDPASDSSEDGSADNDSGDNDSGDNDSGEGTDTSSDSGQEDDTGSIRELLRRMFSWR